MAKNRPQDRRDGNMQDEPRQQGAQLREDLQKQSSTKMQHGQQKARQSGSQTSMKQKKGNQPR